ncbi:hypothetical protein vseg_005253 [Gypsophila vaccaria]
MSCNGCRVLRKGCSETCILRPCLQWIDTADSQGHATVFVAKFFGRSGLMSFLSNVPSAQRPALFQSLLYEACGRTVNPVSGAVGLMWSGNWQVCQSAVETVLKGGTPTPIQEYLAVAPSATTPNNTAIITTTWYPGFSNSKRRNDKYEQLKAQERVELASWYSEESATTVSLESELSADNYGCGASQSQSQSQSQAELLNLFV